MHFLGFVPEPIDTAASVYSAILNEYEVICVKSVKGCIGIQVVLCGESVLWSLGHSKSVLRNILEV